MKFLKSLTKLQIFLTIFVLVLSFSLLKTFQKGSTIADENGYIQSNNMQLNYKYHESWNMVPEEASQTFYITDDSTKTTTLIRVSAFPLSLFNTTEENALLDISKVYEEEYETIVDTNNIYIGEREARKLSYFSKGENFGGEIYIVVDEAIGYALMFTEEMSSLKKLERDEIKNNFLADITIN